MNQAASQSGGALDKLYNVDNMEGFSRQKLGKTRKSRLGFYQTDCLSFLGERDRDGEGPSDRLPHWY